MPISSCGLPSKPASSHTRGVPPRLRVTSSRRQPEANVDCTPPEPSGWSAVWSLFTGSEPVKATVRPAKASGAKTADSSSRRSGVSHALGKPSASQSPSKPRGAQPIGMPTGSQTTRRPSGSPTAGRSSGSQTPGRSSGSLTAGRPSGALATGRPSGGQSPRPTSKGQDGDQITDSREQKTDSSTGATSPLAHSGADRPSSSKSSKRGPQPAWDHRGLDPPVPKSGRPGRALPTASTGAHATGAAAPSAAKSAALGPRTARPCPEPGDKRMSGRRPPSAVSDVSQSQTEDSDHAKQAAVNGAAKIPSFDPPRQPSFQPPKRDRASGTPVAPRPAKSALTAQRSAKAPTRSPSACKSAAMTAKGGDLKAASSTRSRGAAKTVQSRGRSASQPTLNPGSRLGFERPVSFPPTPPGHLSLDRMFIEDLTAFESETRSDKAGLSARKLTVFSWLT